MTFKCFFFFCFFFFCFFFCFLFFFLCIRKGVDLTRSMTAKLAESTEKHGDGGVMNDLTSLVTAIPNQGTLGPYEKIPIFLRFSPR